ncbi:MAG TPA: HAMP domain-containing sensor histidine kinase [Pirellulaceae bacterium]|nr:HAMP domain-containing sensor histidine kinase [Pirellulaceae bacterium]
MDIVDLRQQLSQAATSSPELSALLPPVLQSLERLAALERDFAGELQREKLTSMAALAYGASHEINNPLANIAARAQSLLAQERDPQRRRSLATINAQAFRAHEMIADLMLFAKPPAPRMASVDLAVLADQVIKELSETAAAQGTSLARDESGPVTLVVEVDEVQIGVALRALCQNALEALRSGGSIEISLFGDGGSRQIRVADTGPGLTAEAKKHLFDPFYSGREAGRGLGLGLSKVWRIMELHGGQVLVDSRPGHGSTFTLVFAG